MRPFQNLHETGKLDAYQRCTKKVKRIIMRYSRLVSKLESEKVFFAIENDTPVKLFLQKVHAYIGANWKCSQQEITKLVLDLDLNDQKGSSSNEKERSDCVNHICESLKNMKHNLDGNNGAIRYSSCAMNIALSLYLKSKQGYDDLRASGLVCLPSPQKLNDRTQRLRVKDGGDHVVYMLMK